MELHTGFCHNEIPTLLMALTSFPALVAYLRFRLFGKKRCQEK